MSDAPDASGQVPRRPPRVGDGAAPVSGALAIVLAAVAVVAGFFILRSISDGGATALDLNPDAANGSADVATEEDTTEDSTPVPTLPTTTTEPPLVVDGASVIVANANSVSGSASSMSRALQTTYQFTVVDPVNASAAVGDQDVSSIYYDATVPAARSVAESLDRVLGGVSEVTTMPDPPPTSDGQLNGATVLLLLGNDKAGRTLEELAPAVGATPAVTNPPVATSG